MEKGLYSAPVDGSHLSLAHRYGNTARRSIVSADLDGSPVWGSFFTDKLDGDEVETAAMRLLKDHADLCCACLSAFTEHESSHVYAAAPEHPLGSCALLQHEIPSYALYYYTNTLASNE